MASSVMHRPLATLSSAMRVALVSTHTLACGAYWLRRAMVSAIMFSNWGWSVGSPLPAKVITSGRMPSDCILRRVASSCVATSLREGSGASFRPLGLKPHSQ